LPRHFWGDSDRHLHEHPREHLADFHGILQAAAYTGYKALYEPGPDGVARVREAACWAHLRRDFHDVWKATDSPIAREALERIGALYDVEAAINGQPRDIRHAVRQKRSRPKVEAFGQWCERQLTLIPGKGDLAKAMRYALNRWASFTLFLDDGRVAILVPPLHLSPRSIAPRSGRLRLSCRSASASPSGSSEKSVTPRSRMRPSRAETAAREAPRRSPSGPRLPVPPAPWCGCA